MPTVAVASRILRCTLALSILLGWSFGRSFAQSVESDSAPSQPGMGASATRGQNTAHHEAGSVEASGAGLRDRHFLRMAMAASLEDMELSQLALRRTTDEEIRQIASYIVADQSRINENLKAVAETQGVMLPTKLPSGERAAFQRLKALPEDDFDRDYITTLTANQRRDLREYRLEAATTEDESLRTMLLGATRMIHDHLVSVEHVAHEKGIPLQHAARVETSSSSH